MLLHRKTNLFILTATLITTTLIYVVGSQVIGSFLLDVIDSQRQAITENIKEDVAVLDELLLNVEEKWDRELAVSLPEIAEKLVSVQASQSEVVFEQLNKLKQQYQLSDIHLINKDLTVFASTFEQEVGLDMSKFSEAYTDYLTELFGKGKFAAHRLSPSDVNGRLKKYAYFSLPNSDILVNVDIDVQERLATGEDNRLGAYIFGQYVEKFANRYELIDDIDVLITSETDEWSLLHEGRFVEPDLARRIYKEEMPASDNELTVFIPVTLSAYEILGFKSVLHINYNNVSERLLKQLRYLLIGIALFVIFVNYVLLRFGAGTVFLNRFKSLNNQIKHKKLGDNKTISIAGNDELSMIADEVNSLMTRMELQIEENKGLYAKSTTDSLTQIANRRYFDDQLSIEWKQARRLKSEFSIIMLDIDYFKEYNDCYGHVAGDTCIKKLAALISSELTRPRDFVARFGGEEFMCLLPETDIEGAQVIANHLRERIQMLDIEHIGSKIAKTITVSVGCLTVNGATDIDENGLIHEVDTLLYLSKTTGKNKVSTDYLR